MQENQALASACREFTHFGNPQHNLAVKRAFATHLGKMRAMINRGQA